MKTFRAVSAGLAFGLAGLALSCGTPSEEEQIRDFLKETTALAEKRDLPAVLERISPDYLDFEGRHKPETERLLEEYFRRTRGIVIHLLWARLEETAGEGKVTVAAEMVFSHGAAEALRKLIRLSGEYYRFNLELFRPGRGKWQIVYAEWEPIGLADLFPESMAALKKLFPDL